MLPDDYSDKNQPSVSSLVLEKEESSTVNITETNAEQLVQRLVMCDINVLTESTTAQTISNDTDVPSHGTVLYTDTDMKNGTDNLERDDASVDAMHVDLSSADTDVEDKVHKAETVSELQHSLNIQCH